MSKSNKLKDEYDKLYGHLPDSQEELLQYIKNHWRISEKNIDRGLEYFDSIKWKSCSYSIPIIPKPSPRPRSTSNGSHFYVKGAALHKRYIKSIIEIEKIIYTICSVNIKIYQPTPISSMTNTEIYLAQLGLIRPISGGDWDNFAKTYCDAVQDTLIINDNIIYKGTCERFYSLKPRVDITIAYQDRFDSKFNERKIVNSISYKNNLERIKNDEEKDQQ